MKQGRFSKNGLGAAERFVDTVNNGPEYLRSWAGRWYADGRDLPKDNSVLHEVNDALEHYRPFLLPCGVAEADTSEPLMALGTKLTFMDFPESTGGHPVLGHASTAGEKAIFAAQFAYFVTGDYAGRFKLCARNSCDHFFLSIGRRSTYCSRGCAGRDTANKTMSRRRKRQQQAQLKTARQLCERYEKNARWPPDWKERVASRVGTRKNWVTLQVNRGLLPAPPVTL